MSDEATKRLGRAMKAQYSGRAREAQVRRVNGNSGHADDIAAEARAKAVQAFAASAGTETVKIIRAPRPGDLLISQITSTDDPPPRQWAYGRFLIFGAAAVLGAVDGGGKGSIAVVMMLAMISGRPLLGEKVWRTGPVLIVSYEDSRDEWHRRIAAACIHHGIKLADVLPHIHFVFKLGGKISFAVKQGDKLMSPHGSDVAEMVIHHKAVLLVIDPLNHCHDLQDGNNNVMMAYVASEIARIAEATGAAVLVLHHLRKGSSGSADDLMGATSLRATFRSTLVLSRMTPQEGNALSIRPADAWRYLRVNGSKENYSPAPDQATWFKLESVQLANASPDYPDGDSVGAATRWTPPPLFQDVAYVALEAIFEAVRLGPTPGEFYTPSRIGNSPRWLGNVILQHTGKSKAEAQSIIQIWIDAGVLIEGQYDSVKTKNLANVTLCETKAITILQPNRPADPPD